MSWRRVAKALGLLRYFLFVEKEWNLKKQASVKQSLLPATTKQDHSSQCKTLLQGLWVLGSCLLRQRHLQRLVSFSLQEWKVSRKSSRQCVGDSGFLGELAFFLGSRASKA